METCCETTAILADCVWPARLRTLVNGRSWPTSAYRGRPAARLRDGIANEHVTAQRVIEPFNVRQWQPAAASLEWL